MVTIGTEGWAELFLDDRTRIRVRESESGTQFSYFSKLPELEGYVVRLGSGSMSIQMGSNPVRVSLPFIEVVLAGPGTEVTVAVDGQEATVSRGAGESDGLAVHCGGLAETIEPGAWTTLTAKGLSDKAQKTDQPERVEGATKIETFHYVTGEKGRGELTLPSGSRVHVGHDSDLMLSANRGDVGPFYFAQIRRGNFAVRMEKDTGLLLESTRLRYSFGADAVQEAGPEDVVVPSGEEGGAEATETPGPEEPGEEGPEEGEGEGEGEEGESEGDEPTWAPHEPPEGLKAIREDDSLEDPPNGEGVLKVELSTSIEMITNDTGHPLVLTILDPRWAGMVVEVPAGGQVTVMVDADGNIMVHNLSDDIPVLVTASKPGSEPLEIAPGDMISGKPEEPTLLERVPPELIDKIYESMTEPSDVPTVPEPEAPAPSPIDTAVNNAPPGESPGAVTPPDGEAYDDAGFVDEVEDASPYKP
ncbi:MAG: hypothetical protein ACYTFG_17345 [Planctomycetota bacterium]